MGIMSSLELRATAGALGPPRDPVVAAWFGGMANSSTGLSITPDSAMRSTVVHRCVSLLAETYASLPLQVFEELDNGNKEIAKANPRYKLLHDAPNRFQTSFEWREMMAGHFALRNRAYSEIVASGGNAADQLIPLHPDRVRPFRAPDGRLAFEYSPPSGAARIILQSEMHYLHGMALDSDGCTPLSPVTACREAIGLSLAAEEHGARLFGNGTRLGGVLKMPAGKSMKDDPARARLLKSWREAQSGLKNVGKTAILEDGLEWQELGMSSVDAQFVEFRGLQIAELCRIWGIPPHLVGDLSRSTNNNIEHQGLEFVRHTIRPGAARWEQALRRDLFAGTNFCAEFNLDGLMRGDKAAQSAFYSSALQNGYMTRNEVRALENNNKADAAGMDDFSVQQNMTLIQLLETLTKANQKPAQPTQGAGA